MRATGAAGSISQSAVIFTAVACMSFAMTLDFIPDREFFFKAFNSMA